MAKKKILICGASGFIGRNICERLSHQANLELFGTFRRRKPSFSNPGKIKLIQADLTNPRHVKNLMAGKDVVIQAAATTSGAKDIVTRPYIHIADNAVMNSLIFRSCYDHGVKHVIFFSCVIMYPERGKPVLESDFNYDIIPKYFGAGWTKVYLEKMCEFYSRLGRSKFTVIRHSNIYGPHDKYDLERAHVFGATIRKVMSAKEKVVVWGNGEEERDLLYVDDLVSFVECALRKQKAPFYLVNVGLGKSISVLDLVKKIVKHSGRKLKIELDPSKPTIRYKLALNIRRAKAIYGWKPEISLDQGIQKTLKWYRANYL